MAPDLHTVTGELWLHEGPGGWHFLTLPAALSDEIREQPGGSAKAFGSRRVEATLGDTTWRTSLFPDAERGTYLLPVSAPVRKAESVGDGDTVIVRFRLLDPSDAA